MPACMHEDTSEGGGVVDSQRVESPPLHTGRSDAPLRRCELHLPGTLLHADVRASAETSPSSLGRHQFFHPRVQLLSCSLRELSQMHSFLCYRKAPCFLYGVTGLQPFDRPLVTAQSSGCSALGCTPGFVTCSHPTAAASPPPAWPQPRPLHSSESKLPAVLAAPRVFLPLCLLRLPWGLHCPFSLVAW